MPPAAPPPPAEKGWTGGRQHHQTPLPSVAPGAVQPSCTVPHGGTGDARSPRSAPRRPSEEAGMGAVGILLAEREVSKAVHLLTTKGLGDLHDPGVQRQMKEKHPLRKEPITFVPDTDAPRLRVDLAGSKQGGKARRRRPSSRRHLCTRSSRMRTASWRRSTAWHDSKRTTRILPARPTSSSRRSTRSSRRVGMY